MKVQRLCYFLSFSLISISCLRISDIPIPESEGKLVLNALFNPDSTWKVHVALAANTASEENYLLPYVEDARVEIVDETGNVITLPYAENGNYRRNEFPEVGTVYKLRVYVPGFDSLQAVSSIPLYPDEMEANWNLEQKVPQNDRWGGVFDAFPLSLTFKDPVQQDNFYLLGMAYKDSCLCKIPFNEDSIYIDPFDDLLKVQSIENSNLPDAIYQDDWRVLLTDQTFGGSSKRVDLMISDTTYLFYQSLGIPLDNRNNDSLPPSRISTISQRLFIRAYADTWSLSRDLFSYMHTYFLQGKNTADPFASFNNVSGNIEGGLGVFAGYQRKLIQVYSD